MMASDIIFVKGVRNQDSEGGFSDTDVIAGCQFIFDKAEQMGKPAVINLSLGGHSSPHDGSSLYEQSLSGLTGPGKIIVAAAGNEGIDFIHAGGSATAGVINETIVEVDSSQQSAFVDMWYDSGVISSVAVFACVVRAEAIQRQPSGQEFSRESDWDSEVGPVEVAHDSEVDADHRAVGAEDRSPRAA